MVDQVGVGVWVRVGVATLHGILLVSRRFVVGLIVLVLLVVEAAVSFHRAAPSTCVSPAGRWVVTLAGGSMVGEGEASRGRPLALGRFR